MVAVLTQIHHGLSVDLSDSVVVSRMRLEHGRYATGKASTMCLQQGFGTTALTFDISRRFPTTCTYFLREILRATDYYRESQMSL